MICIVRMISARHLIRQLIEVTLKLQFAWKKVGQKKTEGFQLVPQIVKYH